MITNANTKPISNKNHLYAKINVGKFWNKLEISLESGCIVQKAIQAKLKNILDVILSLKICRKILLKINVKTNPTSTKQIA